MEQNIKFGTDGWRAIIAEEFTFKNVSIVSQAIGKFILKNYKKESPILIGYDTRFLAKTFAKCCALELFNLGLLVQLSNNVIPTPVIAFAASKVNKTNGAIQFTASHNPPEYCGMKYITPYGGPAPIEVTDEITSYISGKWSVESGQNEISNIKTFDTKNKYILHLKTLIDFNLIKKADLKVVYDPMYGAGNNYLDYILKESGCKTITIHDKNDPLFGGLLPEPREEHLKDLKNCILENKANVGLATDGDADRLGAIDMDGKFFSPNKIASMILRHLVKNKKLTGKVVRTLSTTHLMDRLAKVYGLELVETQVGFKWIYPEMLKGNVLIGAEESGGISILNHVPDKDAILAGMLVVEMIAYEKKTLSQIYSDTLNDAKWIPINYKLDLHMNEKQKHFLISTLQSGKINMYGNLNVRSVNTVEGAKYLLDDESWFLARASGTEPMARVYFEATSNEALDKMKNTVNKIVEEACLK